MIFYNKNNCISLFCVAKYYFFVYNEIKINEYNEFALQEMKKYHCISCSVTIKSIDESVNNKKTSLGKDETICWIKKGFLQ